MDSRKTDGRKYAPGERDLARRLRDEAEASRPDFSEELQQRICLVIERGDVPTPRREKPSPRARRILVAVAATLLVAGAAVLGWQLRGPEVAAPKESGDDATVEDVSEELAGLSDVSQRTVDGAMQVDSALTTEGWVYLDHDARLATELVLSQLPLDMLASNAEP